MDSQQFKTVSYYALTESQIREIVSEGVKATLKEMGFSPNQMCSTSDYKKDDALPVEYWVKKLHVNRATLWRRQKAGLLNPTYMGKKLFYRPSDIDQMFAKLNKNQSQT